MTVKFTLREVEGELFVNREGLVGEMVKTLSDPKLLMGFALYGPRRIGKSSLLLEVRRRLGEKKEIVPIYFSLWELDQGTIAEFNKELTARILKEYKPRLGLKQRVDDLLEYPRRAVHGIITQLKIKAKIQEDIELLLTYDQELKQDPGSIKKVFQLAEELAIETNTRCILMLDEFPDITELKYPKKVGERIIKLIRTIHGRQKHTLLCISGSSKATMNIVALSSTSPFYRQFLIREVKPLQKKYVREIITENIDWNVTDKAIDRIYEFTNGIPYYVQFIGRQLYMHDRKKTDEHDIENIIEDFLEEEGNILFKKDYEVLSAKEKMIVESMATKDITKPSQIAKMQREPITNVYPFIEKLMEKGVLERKTKGIYCFVDPIFKRWLKRKIIIVNKTRKVIEK